MSSDPKKPGFDAPPPGTPDLLQKDLSLDRRRRVPTFEELQAVTPRPPPSPTNYDSTTQTVEKHIPPGLQARQPALQIRTPTPPTQPGRPLGIPPPPAPQARPAMPPPPPAPRTAMPPPAPQTNAIPMRTPAPQANAIPARAPVPPAAQQATPQPARTSVPPPPNAQAARMPPPAGQPARVAPAGIAPPPQANAQPARIAPPPPQARTAPPLPQANMQPARMSPPAAAMPRPAAPAPAPAPAPQRAMPPAPDEGTNVIAPPRAPPPSPTEFAQARPAVMPQVTPSTMMQGAVVPEGQTTPLPRPSQMALKPVPPRVVHDEPEPLTVPAGNPSRHFAQPPPAAPVARPAGLPAEMLVTQPGLPGPFAQARTMPQQQAIPQRPPSMPELPAIEGTNEQPRFSSPQFEAPLVPTDGGTVTAEPAALWRRTGAYLTDLLFVGVMVLGFLMLAMTVIAPKNLTPLQQLFTVAVPGLALAGILAFVYTTLFAFLWNGRTPGRRLMGIHLVDSTGHAPGPARALIRAVLSLVSFGLFLSGFWLALFDRHGQTLHDKLTRTFVVKLQDA